MFLNPRFSSVGLVAFPFFLFFELLGPIIEISGFLFLVIAWPLGLVDMSFAILFFCVSILLGVVVSLSSVLLEGMTFRRYPKVSTAVVLMTYGVLENFGYRQLHTLWRFKGMWDRLRGATSWGQMERSGFGGSSDSASAKADEAIGERRQSA
jgi:hypothetical protein